MIPDSFLQELKLRTDIQDVVADYVKLKRSGRNMLGLCPFHNEKTPSFTVNSERGFFHCFGCGVGGDVITFIMKIENLDYVSAVKLLADRAGLSVPDDSFDDATSKLRLSILEMNREAAKFFHKNLYSAMGKDALSYLHGRALDEKTIRHFGLGYSLPSRRSLVEHLRAMGFADGDIVQANLAYISKDNNPHDRFYSRVMFPIIDLRGNVLGFGGRQLGDYGPKYINTSDTIIFKKSYNLFSLNFAKNTKDDSFILTEGYMDVISLFQAGFKNAVATLGTSLTQGQAEILSRHKGEVVIAYDSDSAGQKAAERAIPILRGKGINVRVLNMGSKKDPDEYIKSYGEDGPARFKNLLKISSNDVEYRLDKLKSGINLEESPEKVQYLTGACKVLASIDNAIERDVYASRLASELEVQKSSILQQIEADRKSLKQKERRIKNYAVNRKSGEKSKYSGVLKKGTRSVNAQRALINYLLSENEIDGAIFDTVAAPAFTDERLRCVYENISQRFKSSRAFGLSALSADFSEDDIEFLAEILSKSTLGCDNAEGAKRYAEIINDEYQINKSIQKDDVSSEVIEQMLKKLREEKK